ncbi:unnamed protein product [Pylaiella littoralis]
MGRRCPSSLLILCAAAATVTAAVVEVGSLTTVTVEAPLYDTNLSAAGGCDPAGCSGDKTRDGDTASVDSRWSCKPDLGTDGAPCSITFTLADSENIESLSIATYKGDTRTRTMEIYVDGILQTSWTSSGTTAGLENVDLGVIGQAIEVRGVLAGSEWLSIMEVEILVDDEENGGNDDASAVEVEAGTLGTVTATAALYDPSLGISNGCDPDGCTAALTRDGDESAASRWSCAPSLGGTCSISYDLGAVRDLSDLRLAMYKGNERQRSVEVYVDGVLVTTWTSSGTTLDFESIDLSGSSGQEVTVTGVLGNSEWLSIIETEIMVMSGDGVSSSLTPATSGTPAPVSTSSPASGVLQTVGLTPLARGDGTDDERYALKDGDFSTSWACTGDPTEPNDDGITIYECEINIGLVYFRHVKQVKIALVEGSVRDMRIGGRFRSTVAEAFVTSSGTTDLETYEFDYSASSITISAVLDSPGQTIAISEASCYIVEFVEEVIDGEVLINAFGTPYDNGDGLWNEPTTDGFEWTSDSAEAIGLTLSFGFAGYFEDVTEMQMKFPVGDTYKFDLSIYNDLDGTGEPYVTIPDLESADVAGLQSFDLTSYVTDLVTSVTITMRGTGSGADGFKLLDARFLGTQVDNPSDTFYVGTTRIQYWGGFAYPDFVGEGTGDQKAIMGAICAVKKASFDGVDCVGGVDTATGLVDLAFGAYYVDGNIFMKSGVHLEGFYTDDDSPYTTDIQLEEGAAGKTDIDAILVMDDIQDALVEDLWIRGLYDPESSNGSPAVSGLGSSCVSVVGSTNITLEDIEIRFCDGDAAVVRGSTTVNIDAGSYDEAYLPWTIGRSRGTGLTVDTSENVWVRRHTIYDNGVAGLHIMNSNNFTFEATIASEGSVGAGNVGSLDGQQPIEIIIENSSLVTFQDMRVQSVNDPVMTISTSTAVSFTNTGLSSVETGTCVIQTDSLSDVTIDAAEDELSLEDSCYVKVDNST